MNDNIKNEKILNKKLNFFVSKFIYEWKVDFCYHF